MGEQKPEKTKKHICAGLLAHVDAGKTTLAEGILYSCGVVRTLGRVDNQDAVLDNFTLERERGITIFAKQARIETQDLVISLLDTPGHVDFSAEMERTLQVLDYAVLVIGGNDGVQGHVLTLWRLLKRYRIPVFLFVNKMDMPGTEQEKILQELRKKLDENCIVFSGSEKEVFRDELSMCSEELMEEYLETGTLQEKSIAKAIAERQVFPCYFGSALKLMGVDALLDGIGRYTVMPEYGEKFAARVFKITRDSAGARLTWLKVTGGALKVKMPLQGAVGKKNGANRAENNPRELWEEKADQLRLYTGGRYTVSEEVQAGEICAVTGLTRTFAGQGIGEEQESMLPILEPVLTYRLFLPEGFDAVKALSLLRQLEEEEPQLHIVWKEEVSEIHVQVMGEVQTEILKSLLKERFGLDAAFGAGSIVYKETIAEPVVGIGHFEPLRHYAEVHLLLEPGEPGSGLQFAASCSEDMLAGNWQRLVLTHLEERVHPGVLTAAEITDMRITLIAGRAHLKHTEGGDFRQATYRALRQGLRKSKCVLLEPYFDFTLEVPTENVGRAMSDIRRMEGTFDAPVTEGETTILTGSAPVSTMQDYQKEVRAYTRGHGRFSCVTTGYRPCHNAEEVVEQMQYDSEADVNNPTGSVFCAHGAGFVVSWDKVEEYAHVENAWKPGRLQESLDEECCGAESFYDEKTALRAGNSENGVSKSRDGKKGNSSGNYITQEEIEEIFRQTYGKRPEEPGRYRRYHAGARREAFAEDSGRRQNSDFGGKRANDGLKEKYLLVDGYNIIFAWDDLRELAAVNIDSARDKLMDILCNYQGIKGGTLILVFDAYKVKGNPGAVQQYHNIYVVYTKEAETADQYIEKTVHKIARIHDVTVATSDGLEQMIIWGDGAGRLSAAGLREAVEEAAKQLAEQYLTEQTKPLSEKLPLAGKIG